jgi:uncharacterized protein YndB with AHSA1/START domain
MKMQNQQPVKASKEFSVSVQEVFQAWNDPEKLKQWWRPMGNNITDVTNELKEGGTVRYTFSDNSLVISGKYEEVKLNEKLRYTWNWEFTDDAVRNAAYRLCIEFVSRENGSEIHVTQENVQSAEAVHPNAEGWDKGLADLEKFLAGTKGSNAPHTGVTEPGYRERPEQVKVGGG